MKFLEKFIAPKKLTLIHTLVSFALIIVMFFLSFGTIFTLEVGKGGAVIEKVTDAIDTIAEKSGSDNIDVEVPTEVDVSFPMLAKSAGKVVKIISALGDSVKETVKEVKQVEEASEKAANGELSGDETLPDLSDNAPDIKLSDIINQELVNLLCVFMAILNAFSTNFILGAAYAFILITVIMVPISCIFHTIVCIVSMIKNRKDPGKAFHRVAKSFSSIIAKFPLILLVKALVPDVQLGGAVIAMFVAIIVGLVVNFLVSRVKTYEKAELKYLNVLQICSLASLVAFIVFFVNMAKTHMLDSFFKNSGKFLLNQVEKVATKSGEMDFLPLILITVFVVVLIMICKYLVDIVTRLACMSSSKSDAHVFTVVAGLALIIVPVVLMKTEFNLQLSDDQMSKFIAYSVGLVLMLVVEIVMLILSNSLCADVPAERRKQIVTGAYVHEIEEETEDEEAEATDETTVAEESETAEAEDAAEPATEEVKEESNEEV